MDLEIGSVVAERYRLEGFLGEGGMGAVWSARHVVTGKVVALKVLKGGTEEHRRRFVQEARVAAAIRHANVVDVHDVLALADGRPVLVMDLLEGEPLSEALERRGPYSLEELGPIMLQVLAGIGAAHAVGVVHRDLKPENVFLCGSDVKVLDFGIAKLTALTSAIQHTAALTQTGSVLGTPMYMAPEQVFGEKSIDHRADIWSLGVVMYECLTGECPIRGENVGQIFKSISQRSFPPILRVLPNLEPTVADLVDRMLSTRVEDRPESARQVAAILAFHLNLDVPPIEEPSWSPESRRSIKVVDPNAETQVRAAPPRSRRAWWFGAAAVCLVGTIAAGTHWFIGRGDALASTVEEGADGASSAVSVSASEPPAPVRPEAAPATSSATTAPRVDAPLVSESRPVRASSVAATTSKRTPAASAISSISPPGASPTSTGPGRIHGESPYR
jgi:eukaryotic-like serine/threonine-protein kinase